MKRLKLYFNLLIAFSSFGSLNSQSVSTFENIIIEINDVGNAKYELAGKRIFIDEFEQGFQFPFNFVGSCTSSPPGSTETGQPLYSQEIDSDAIILPIADCAPEDFPQRINKPLINRKGHSSFLAFKNWATDSQKVWINISVGAYLYQGGTIYDWEYQIRYFENKETAEDSMVILTVPNSGSISSIEKITDFNVEINANGYIKGKVNALKLNQSTGTIDDDYIDATVRLFETGSLVYSEEVACTSGSFSFDSVDNTKSYYLSVFYDTVDVNSDPVSAYIQVDNINADTIIENNRAIHGDEVYFHLGKVTGIKKRFQGFIAGILHLNSNQKFGFTS